MNSRAVVDALLRKKKANRVALMGSPWADTIAAWVAQGYPTRKVYKKMGDKYWLRHDGRWADVEIAGEYEEPVPPWEHFGYDMVGVGPWMDVLPWRGYEELVEENENWDIKRNGAGAALKYWKHKSGTPEHIDFRMVTREIWEQDYRSHLLDLDPDRVDVEEMRENLQILQNAHVWTHFGNLFVLLKIFYKNLII